MSNKRLIVKYKSPQAFHKEALKFYTDKTLGSDKDAFYCSTFSYAVYNSLCQDVLAGHYKITESKLMAEMAQDFNFMKRKVDLWNKINNKFDGLFNLLQWKVESKDTYADKKKHSVYGKQAEESKASPILETMGDGRGGVNWGELNKTTMKGFYQDGKFSPNVESGMDDGWKFNTTTHKEQKNQQIARIITAMLECEVFFSDIIEKYRRKYTWQTASAPGEHVFSTSGRLKYIPPKYDEEEEVDDETGQVKPKNRPELDDISEEVWLIKKEQGEAVETAHYLEYLVRYKKRILSTIRGKNAAGQEIENRKIVAIDKLMKGFSRPVYISTLDNYDKVMSRIEGFKNFKSELRLKLELMWDDKLKGLEPRQKNYCLLGKPGVGKTEIVKTLSKAWRRPLVIISMGGATDTKDIEGTPPTFQSANWGKLLEGMAMINVAIFVQIDELKEQLAEYEALKNKTEFQKSEIKELTELIKDMTEKGETERKVDANSKAPIVLFDEAEKVSNSAVLDALGKVLDPNVNQAHFDKFFEGLLNLKYCVLFLTMNWEERCPKFIKDRCQMVDIELLTYPQRIKILEQFANRFIRQAWPIMDSSGKKPDLNANKAYEENDLLTTKQQSLRDKIGDEILKACITETWGVRQAILNLGNVIDIMRVADKDGKLNDLHSMDWWSWDSDKDGVDDEVSDKTRTLKYDELTDSSGRRRTLQLSKITDQDFIPQKKNKKWARVQTVKNTIPSWPDYAPVEDEFFEPNPQPDNSGFGFENFFNSFSGFTDAHEREIKKLKAEMDDMKKHCKEMLEEKDRLTEQQKLLLEKTLNELEASKGNIQELTNTVERLTKELREAKLAEEQEPKAEEEKEPTTRTIIIKTHDHSKVRFGVNEFQQSVQIIKFDKDVGKDIKSLRISDCKDLIQIDLTNLPNLEKISLRRSKWDSVKGAKNIIPEYKLVIKDCEDVSLDWVEGTNVGVIEIDKPSEKKPKDKD